VSKLDVPFADKTKDPYFETVPATRLDGKPSKKVKKRRKALPPGISEHDGKVLTKVKRRAYRLDMCLFTFMGIKFGWGSVIGIIPGLVVNRLGASLHDVGFDPLTCHLRSIGDVLDALLALMVFKTCNQIEDGLPAGVKMKMFLNIAFDFVIGIVPFVGDLMDAAFRANSRNALLLEQHLREKGKQRLRKAGQPVPDVDPSDPDEYDRLRRGETSADGGAGSANSPRMPTTPQTAEVRDERGWWGRSSRSRIDDIETGVTPAVPRENTRRSSRRERDRRDRSRDRPRA
jgi:hypothetical protein